MTRISIWKQRCHLSHDTDHDDTADDGDLLKLIKTIKFKKIVVFGN